MACNQPGFKLINAATLPQQFGADSYALPHVDRSHEADRQLGSQGLDPLHEQAVGHGCIQQGAGHTAMQEARISLMSLTNDKGSTHRAIHVW